MNWTLFIRFILKVGLSSAHDVGFQNINEVSTPIHPARIDEIIAKDRVTIVGFFEAYMTPGGLGEGIGMEKYLKTASKYK